MVIGTHVHTYTHTYTRAHVAQGMGKDTHVHTHVHTYTSHHRMIPFLRGDWGYVWVHVHTHSAGMGTLTHVTRKGTRTHA